MIINIEDVWQDAEQDHFRFHSNLLRVTINSLLTYPNTALEHKVGVFLERNFEALVKGIGDDLAKIVSDFGISFSIQSEQDAALTMLSKHVDYEAFSDKTDFQNKPWSAYKLCHKTRYVICPYCHLAPIDTAIPTKENDHAYRPALDHFFCQKRYPYLALTLANLIPVCDRCNGSQFKHDKDFIAIPHLNPLKDLESIRFELHQVSTQSNLRLGSFIQDEKASKYEIKLQTFGLHVQKGNTSLATFDLQRRYSIFLEDAFRLRRQLRTAMSRKKMIMEAIPKLDTELEDCVGFDPREGAYKNKLKGRLILDIFQSVVAEFPNKHFDG